MAERVFLGWDAPFLGLAVDWLLRRRDELPTFLLIVPTAQSGRRLREALAAAAGSLLAPPVLTPGSLLQTSSPEVAPDWVERLAWRETLASIPDWTPFAGLFPVPPEAGSGWAGGFAAEMLQLRRSLRENGLTLADAAERLSASPDAGRWEALARLERRVEDTLARWNLSSRSQQLRQGIGLPPPETTIVLAGVTDMPPLLADALHRPGGRVVSLIGAPLQEAPHFDPLGMPLPLWAERPLPWPEAGVHVVADHRQQAAEALRLVSETQRPSAEVAIGSADPEVGTELARAFSRAGWNSFHPAAQQPLTGVIRWLHAWRRWLEDPKLSTLGELLALPQTGFLIGGRRAQISRQLASLRDRWMVLRPEDLERRLSAASLRPEEPSSEALQQAIQRLLETRAAFLESPFSQALGQLLPQVGGSPPEASQEIRDWLHQAAPHLARLGHPPLFWLDLLLAELPAAPPAPPDNRVIDIQGWLELLFEPGPLLLLCGMNEGRVPGRDGGEPWLSDASRQQLGLPDSSRTARDAFLYASMCHARLRHGQVHVLCGKTGSTGESLLPSRLLLQAPPTELPARVRHLFQEVEPPEAGLRWEADWKWTPPRLPPPARISATSLSDYLACPFRYYLKHVIGMRVPEPERAEWNARNFGTVTHEVLERWGRHPAARDLDEAKPLQQWLSDELDRVVGEWFGGRPPMAIRLQTEALRQRFAWFADVQAAQRAQGWEVIDVEHKLVLPVGGSQLVAQIDRVDRHARDGSLRVIDYKTGHVDGVDKAHRKRLTAASKTPAHLPPEGPAFYEGSDKGKTARFLWTNLQLPLYAAAWVDQGQPMPTPCYFTLPDTQTGVELQSWTQFSEEDLHHARACAEWLVEQISAERFWPPAETVPYDDYRLLAPATSLEEAVEW